MSAHLVDKQEKLQHVLECLSEESANGTPIIVEGKNDEETMRVLGIVGRIVTAKTGGKTRLDTISEIEKMKVKEVVLLMDFDRRGKEWTARLRMHFEHMGIKPLTSYWAELSRLIGKEVKDIEGLLSYMETLKRKIGES